MEGSFYYLTQFKGRVDSAFISRTTVLKFLVNCIQSTYLAYLFKIVNVKYIN